MADSPAGKPIEWGAAARTTVGEAITGDLAIVVAVPGGALVGALDGLGHGPEAARAAGIAGEVLLAHASEDLVSLVGRCHDSLTPTRGAAISLASFSSAGTVTWLGVGSVEGRLVSGDPSARGSTASLRLFRGLPGHELPTLTTATLDVRRGDVLVFASDGISPAFADSLDLFGSPEEIAERVLAGHLKATDDALVLVARYLGAPP